MDARSVFRSVRRGYDPEEVDARLRQMTEEAAARQKQLVELSIRVRELDSGTIYPAERLAGHTADSADHQQVPQLPEPTEDESFDTDFEAHTDSDAATSPRFEAQYEGQYEAQVETGSEFDHQPQATDGEEGGLAVDPTHRAPSLEPEGTATFAQLGARIGEILSLAEAEAAEIRAAATAGLDETRREAEEHAARVRQEADEYALQVRSAADAEVERVADELATMQEQSRNRVEHELDAEFEGSRVELAAALAHVEETRALSQRLQHEAELKAADTISEARERALQMLDEADREVAEATHRRDAINEQLAGVRQMLASLSSIGAPGLTPLVSAVPDPDPVPPPAEPLAVADEHPPVDHDTTQSA